MRTILPRTAVTLTAKKPERIWIKNGIDLETAELFFRYPPREKEEMIEVEFGDSSGKIIKRSIILTTDGYRPYVVDTSDPDNFITPWFFTYMEITSNTDLTLEVFAQEGEATFE